MASKKMRLVDTENDPRLQKPDVGKSNILKRSVLSEVGNKLASQPLNCKRLKSEVVAIKKPTVVPCPAKKEASAAVDDIDAQDTSDPLKVTEYVEDIYAHLRHLECKSPVPTNFIEGKGITDRTRRILVEWMVTVHTEFKLVQESLYLSVALLDRFIMRCTTPLTTDRLQVLGCSCLWLASKFEEIYAPELADFTYITGGACTPDMLQSMEINLLHVIRFEVAQPVPLDFLRRFSKAGKVSTLQHTLAKYLIEMGMLDHNLSSVKPSLLAAAALFLSMMVLKETAAPSAQLWTPTLAHHSRYGVDQLRPLLRPLVRPLFWPPHRTKSVRKKFSRDDLLNVACLRELQQAWLVALAHTGFVVL